MKRIIIALFPLLMFACPSEKGANQPFPIEEHKAALRKIKEHDWPKSYREQDTVLLDRILAEEFQMIGDDGTVSYKTDELEYIKHHEYAYDSFCFEIKRLDVFENGTKLHSEAFGNPLHTMLVVLHGVVAPPSFLQVLFVKTKQFFFS